MPHYGRGSVVRAWAGQQAPLPGRACDPLPSGRSDYRWQRRVFFLAGVRVATKHRNLHTGPLASPQRNANQAVASLT